MKTIGSICVSLFILGAAGCASTQLRSWTSNPSFRVSSNPCYQVRFEPVKVDSPFFEMFLVSITNVSNDNLEIDWNKTRYIHNNRSQGGFVFKGIEPKDIKASSIPADTVSAGQSLSRKIAPIKLLGWTRFRDTSVNPDESGFSPGILPEGENGISLVARCNGEEVVEKLSLTISSEELR